MSTIHDKSSDTIRVLSASMVEKASSGHPGGPMGGADFMHILYTEYMNYDPDDMTWFARDRFYLDAGHMSAMMYSTLHLMGHYSKDDLMNFRQWGSVTPGHPEVDFERGIENTSGPLGLGHAFGIGSAIAERFLHARFGKAVEHMTYIYISDGGIQEEISQGAGRIAGHLGLGNIVMFYDANDIQLSTEVDDVTTEDTAKKYESWGWHVTTIEGNNHDAIRSALDQCIAEKERPSIIIGKTIMGKGVVLEDGSNYEGKVELHGKPLSKSNASFEETIKSLGADPNAPFEVAGEVRTYYDDILNKKREDAKNRKAAYSAWKTENLAKAEKLEFYFSNQRPKLPWEEIVHKENTATRNSSAAVLSFFADHVDNMIVSSADLCNSDKTEAFLKKSSEFKRGDFSGGFLQAGVAELSMAALCIGMGLHGGVIPVCATFFAFSDYMKPAMRVAALMEQPCVFLWTHDAFRVGEDGPTHQPIEQETQLRLLEKLQNHSHRNSMLVLRPCDAHETTVAWKMAFENTDTPSGLSFSRQNISDIPAMGSSRYEEAKSATKGGYIVLDCEGEPDVILLANGSEVGTLIDAAGVLKAQGQNKVRVVSVVSEGVFRNQSESYQNSVLPSHVRKFGLTAGLSLNLEGLVGHNGMVWGVNHFGYSAPYTVLDEKFGFTGEKVAEKVTAYLN